MRIWLVPVTVVTADVVALPLWNVNVLTPSVIWLTEKNQIPALFGSTIVVLDAGVPVNRISPFWYWACVRVIVPPAVIATEAAVIWCPLLVHDSWVVLPTWRLSAPGNPAVAEPDVPPAPELMLVAPPAPPLFEAPVAAWPACAEYVIVAPAAPDPAEVDASATCPMVAAVTTFPNASSAVPLYVPKTPIVLPLAMLFDT